MTLLERLSDLQLGDQKVTLNHLVCLFFPDFGVGPGKCENSGRFFRLVIQRKKMFVESKPPLTLLKMVDVPWRFVSLQECTIKNNELFVHAWFIMFRPQKFLHPEPWKSSTIQKMKEIRYNSIPNRYLAILDHEIFSALHPSESRWRGATPKFGG